jgi:hypothetical protein
MSQQTSVTIDRRKFVARLLALCADALVVTGLGSPSYDVFAAGDSDRYFYLWARWAVPPPFRSDLPWPSRNAPSLPSPATASS